jgi:hypothetical protein
MDEDNTKKNAEQKKKIDSYSKNQIKIDIQ